MSKADLLFTAGMDAAGFNGAVKGMAGSLLKLSGTLIGAGAAFNIIKSMISGAVKEEAAMYGLAAAVKSLKGATEEQYNSLDKLAEKMNQVSGIDGETMRKALTTLVYTTGSVDVAQKTLGATMALSYGKGIELSRAATIVGRAYLGNTIMLKKMGISLGDIKGGLEATSAVENKFSGAMESHLKSTEGAIERVKGAWERFKETMGRSALPDVSTGANWLDKLLNRITNKVAESNEYSAYGQAAELAQRHLREANRGENTHAGIFASSAEKEAGKQNAIKIAEAEVEASEKAKTIYQKAHGKGNVAEPVAMVDPATNKFREQTAIWEKQAEDAKTAAETMDAAFTSAAKSIVDSQGNVKKAMSETFKSIAIMAIDAATKMVLANLAVDLSLGPVGAPFVPGAVAELAVLAGLRAGVGAINVKGAATGFYNNSGESMISTFRPDEMVVSQRQSQLIAGGKMALVGATGGVNGVGGSTSYTFINQGLIGEADTLFREKFAPAMKKHFAVNRGGQIGSTKSGEAVTLNL